MTVYPHDPLTRYLDHYPVEGGTELAVLRVHLLIEELLFAIVSQRFPFPQRVESARLNFSQKTQLAKACIEVDGQNSWLWGAIRELNSARTSMAHHLDTAATLAAAEKFVGLVELSTRDRFHPMDDVEPFLWAGYVLHSELARIGDVSGKRRNALADLLIRPSAQATAVRFVPE